MKLNIKKTVEQRSISFFIYFLKRVSQDKITITAGYLAYISLLSLVPLVVVSLTIFTKIPGIIGSGEKIQNFIFNNFVPEVGSSLLIYINEFAVNAGKMTAFGLGSLFVIAIMLISNIDTILNSIWRSKNNRPKIYSFAIYWMILTLGPLLLSLSLAVSTYLLSSQLMQHPHMTSVSFIFVRYFANFVPWIILLGLYTFVPTIKVNYRNAIIGASVTTVIFYLVKKIFSLYIVEFATYKVIYGALAVIPIIFIWIYLIWVIILLGAELTAALGEQDKWCNKNLEQNIDSVNTKS